MTMATVASRECWLDASGDECQLVVFKSPMLRAESPWLVRVNEHIERFGMVLIDRDSRQDPAWMFGQYEASWYGLPQARIGLLANGLGELPR
jgi:hypothetical protein